MTNKEKLRLNFVRILYLIQESGKNGNDTFLRLDDDGIFKIDEALGNFIDEVIDSISCISK